MYDLLLSCLVLLLLCGAAYAGRRLFAALPETHRSLETLEFARSASSLLVTFTALLLSLLITTVNDGFNKTGSDLHDYASRIILLNSELASLGTQTTAIRSKLRQYTAAVIASTWPDERPPSGDYPKAPADEDEIDSPVLGDMLQAMETDIRRLDVADDGAREARAACLARMADLLNRRWKLIGEAHSTITPPFFVVMLFWLTIIFLSFGMTAPRNLAAFASILMVGVSVSAAIFVILELDGPLDGLIKVGREPMQHALLHLDRLLATSPVPGVHP